jgi:hypothetical protein
MTGKWFDKLLILILENHGWSQVQDCQFVKWFRENGCVFSNWHGVAHPSGPGYRCLFSGQTWSGNEFDGVWRPSILDTVQNVTQPFAGMPADRHNPAKDMRAKAAVDWVPGAPLADIHYLGMDDQNDAHSGPLSQADANVMRALTSFDVPRGPRTLTVVTFDEAFGLEYGTNHVFMGMAGGMVSRGKEVGQQFTHADFAIGLYANWGVEYHNSDGSRGPQPTFDKPWWE